MGHFQESAIRATGVPQLKLIAGRVEGTARHRDGAAVDGVPADGHVERGQSRAAGPPAEACTAAVAADADQPQSATDADAAAGPVEGAVAVVRDERTTRVRSGQ